MIIIKSNVFQVIIKLNWIKIKKIYKKKILIFWEKKRKIMKLTNSNFGMYNF